MSAGCKSTMEMLQAGFSSLIAAAHMLRRKLVINDAASPSSGSKQKCGSVSVGLKSLFRK